MLVLLGPFLRPRGVQEGIWLARQQNLPLTLAWIEGPPEAGYLEGPYFSPSLWQAARRRAWQGLEGPLEEARKTGIAAQGGLYRLQELLCMARGQGLVVLGLPERGLRLREAGLVCALLKGGALGVLVAV